MPHYPSALPWQPMPPCRQLQICIKFLLPAQIEVPLGATEDRVCGTIDIERALSEGVKAFEPGLLAKANRGILFVDEVNLLDDSLIDVVLDSAASGWNTVEREGISIVHPAKFIMIGSGNQEEGEMRPQLLDRFGTAVNVSTIYNVDERVELVMNRMKVNDCFLRAYLPTLTCWPLRLCSLFCRK